DIANTLAVGAAPSPRQEEAFETSLAALQAGESRLRPGAPASEVFAAMDAVLAAENPAWALKGHGGHAIGLGHPEPPHIVGKSDRTLCAGMVLTLEPGVYDPELGGLRLEHNYLVTADGFERLSSHRLGLT